MIALKGKPDIGDKINTQIIQPLIDANARLARTDFPDFNDPNNQGVTATRRLRHRSTPDGLLGRDDAGRLLPDRRRRLGRQASAHRRNRQADGTPTVLHGNAEATVIYNNLPDILAASDGAPTFKEATAEPPQHRAGEETPRSA
ncbi:MAG: hypothetical protein Q7J47_07390 [Azoarcus sp.]|nr:hypothetical protein [Azoarcus sp.]